MSNMSNVSIAAPVAHISHLRDQHLPVNPNLWMSTRSELPPPASPDQNLLSYLKSLPPNVDLIDLQTTSVFAVVPVITGFQNALSLVARLNLPPVVLPVPVQS